MKKSPTEAHFDEIAAKYDSYKAKNSFYYGNLKRLLKKFIPKNTKILEVGCGTGQILASLKPKEGLGIDISREMIKIAKRRYKSSKNLNFSTKMPNKNVKYEYIFMSDVVEHLDNPLKMFENISNLLQKNGTLICTMANPLWEPLLLIWEYFGWKMPEGPHRRITFKEISTILKKTKLKVIKHDYFLLVPIKIPFLTNYANKYLEKYLKRFAFIEYFIVKKA